MTCTVKFVLFAERHFSAFNRIKLHVMSELNLKVRAEADQKLCQTRASDCERQRQSSFWL